MVGPIQEAPQGWVGSSAVGGYGYGAPLDPNVTRWAQGTQAQLQASQTQMAHFEAWHATTMMQVEGITGRLAGLEQRDREREQREEREAYALAESRRVEQHMAEMTDMMRASDRRREEQEARLEQQMARMAAMAEMMMASNNNKGEQGAPSQI